MVSLYPLHSTPFNETITRITQHAFLMQEYIYSENSLCSQFN